LRWLKSNLPEEARSAPIGAGSNLLLEFIYPQQALHKDQS
jgi:hypothetical protein